MSAKQIKKVSPNVEQILKHIPAARDSDMILWLAYCANHHDLINVLGHEAFNKLKNFVRNNQNANVESVGRVRRKLQEQGLYLGQKHLARKDEALKVQKELGWKQRC